MQSNHMILASGSPRRAELLGMVGIKFEVYPANVSEEIDAGVIPADAVRELAERQARFVAQQYTDRWVLGADTVVACDDRILGKPASQEEAVRMLMSLQGRVHQVWTGFCVCHFERNVTFSSACETQVHMCALSPSDIESYVATGEPMDKAGAYAIQGIGSAFVKAIEGSYTNVVGLPVPEVLDALLRYEAIDSRLVGVAGGR